jgi:hypothetical protein
MAMRGVLLRLVRFVRFVLVALALVPLAEVGAVSREGSTPGIEVLEAGSLKSIAAWLKQSGRDGYLAADVADAAGIAREESESVLDAKQRGFRSDNVLRIAQVPADTRRDFLLFMVQRPDGEVTFYLSSVKEGLKKAFVFLPLKNAVSDLAPEEARSSFQQEIAYWQARASGS